MSMVFGRISRVVFLHGILFFILASVGIIAGVLLMALLMVMGA